MNRHHIGAQMLLRAWPFPRGSGRLIDMFFSHKSFPEETVSVQTTDGFEISILPNDHIGRHIYLTGEFDRSTVEVLCAFAEPGDTLLDIGANIGYVSACFLSNVSRSNVVAIEPQPVVVDLLQKNLSQFAGRSGVYPFALSDRDGEAAFEIHARNKGASRLVSEPTANAIQVPVKSAAKFFDDNGIGKIDLVKIDVEGHEEAILAACQTAFAKLQPRVVLFEDHGTKCAPGNSIAKIFNEVGYELYGIHKRLTKLDLKPIRSAADCACNDFVAISRAYPVSARARSVLNIAA